VSEVVQDRTEIVRVPVYEKRTCKWNNHQLE
jgi:hypothetical protein